MQNPLQGLPGAPGGAPTGALGAPAQQPMGMAFGGKVPHIAKPQHAMRFMPRSEPTFGHVLQSAGLRKYENGGQVRPVVLSGRHGMAPGYAHGGLVQAAKGVKGAGRLGDSVLVHVNPQEFQEMEAKFGPHSVNPETGLPEFGWLGNLLKIIAPIALMAIPGVGEALGGVFLGAGAAGATTLGDALIGAGIGGATGGLKGALIGGVTGGIGANLPTNIGGLSEAASRGIEGAGLGAAGSAAGGGNALTGALLGGLTGYAGASLNPSATSTGANTSPVQPESIGSGAALSTPMAGDGGLGSMAVNPGPQGPITASTTAPGATAAPTAPTAPGQSSSGGLFGGGNLMSKALPALMLLSAAGGLSGPKTPTVQTTPPPASNAPGYFSQPFTPTPYSPQINPEALKLLMQNPGLYASQGGPGYYQPGTAGVQLAKGGALRAAAEHISAPSPAARMGTIKGPGAGKDDEVPAVLSDNEHVWSAQDVADLGDGSSDAGHRRMEEMKRLVRKNAGRKNPRGQSGKQPSMGALAAASKKVR